MPGKPITTPWVRGWLLNHPDEAMEVEALRLSIPGSMSLFAKSDRGPFSAILHLPDGPQDGWRGKGSTVALAVRSAMRQLDADLAS
jgi:hypothetical protein